LPGTVVHGEATFEWFEGERFLIWRERADHPDFPDAIVIIGWTDGPQAHSFDSRGVYRIMETRITDEAWEFTSPREQPSDARRRFRVRSTRGPFLRSAPEAQLPLASSSASGSDFLAA
jgi:hypothetical protein